MKIKIISTKDLNFCYHNVGKILSRHDGYNMCLCSKCGKSFKNRYKEFLYVDEAATWPAHVPSKLLGDVATATKGVSVIFTG
jgi:hypothetical protein